MYKYKKSINFEEVCLLLNIRKGLIVVPGHPVILTWYTYWESYLISRPWFYNHDT